MFGSSPYSGRMLGAASVATLGFGSTLITRAEEKDMSYSQRMTMRFARMQALFGGSLLNNQMASAEEKWRVYRKQEV